MEKTYFEIYEKETDKVLCKAFYRQRALKLAYGLEREGVAVGITIHTPYGWSDFYYGKTRRQKIVEFDGRYSIKRIQKSEMCN